MSEYDGADDDAGDRGAEREDEGPGGGPKRVVSNTSVDDILDSLNEANAGDTRAQSELSADSREQPEEGASLDDAKGEGTGAVEGSDGAAKTEQAPNDEPTPRTSTQNDLSSRVERGAVTGADVRAAETGEGRERTPDIDEIDLSLDDLETSTPSESTASGSTVSPTFNRADDPAAESAEDDDRADSNGLLARLRNLFSR